ERQLGDLRADLVERARRLGRDLLARLLEPALPLLLGLVAHPLLHRLAGAPRLGQDLLRVAASLLHQRPVLLEQPARLVARVVGLLERASDLVAARRTRESRSEEHTSELQSRSDL